MNIDKVFLERFLSIMEKKLSTGRVLNDSDEYCAFSYFYGVTMDAPLTLQVLYGSDSYFFNMGPTCELDSGKNKYVPNQFAMVLNTVKTKIKLAMVDGKWVEPTDVDVLEFIDDYCLEESE